MISCYWMAFLKVRGRNNKETKAIILQRRTLQRNSGCTIQWKQNDQSFIAIHKKEHLSSNNPVSSCTLFSTPDLQFKVSERRSDHIFLIHRPTHSQRKSNYLTYHIHIRVTRGGTVVSGTDWRQIINNSTVIWIQTHELPSHLYRLAVM